MPSSAGSVEIPCTIIDKTKEPGEVGAKWKIPDDVKGIVNGPFKGTVKFKPGQVTHKIKFFWDTYFYFPSNTTIVCMHLFSNVTKMYVCS